MTEGYRGTAVRLETRMELVDFEGNPAVEVAADGDVTDRLELQGSVISKDASAPITGTAQFVFRDATGFNPGRHLLKPTVSYHDVLTSHSISTQMGLWVMKPFTVSLDRTERVTIQCSDMTDVLSTFLRADFNASKGEAVGLDLPTTVELAVRETAPAIKGATANAQLKPATLETGLVVQVPPFISNGDRIRVSTETGEYQSRA